MIIGPRPPQLPGRGLGGDAGIPIRNPFAGRQLPPRFVGPRRPGLGARVMPPRFGAQPGPPVAVSGEMPRGGFRERPVFPGMPPMQPLPYVPGPVPMEGIDPGQMNPFGAMGPDPYGIGRPIAGYANDFGPDPRDILLEFMRRALGAQLGARPPAFIPM